MKKLIRLVSVRSGAEISHSSSRSSTPKCQVKRNSTPRKENHSCDRCSLYGKQIEVHVSTLISSAWGPISVSVTRSRRRGGLLILRCERPPLPSCCCRCCSTLNWPHSAPPTPPSPSLFANLCPVVWSILYLVHHVGHIVPNRCTNILPHPPTGKWRS